MSRCQFVTAAQLASAQVLDLYDAVGWTAYTRDPAVLDEAPGFTEAHDMDPGIRAFVRFR